MAFQGALSSDIVARSVVDALKYQAERRAMQPAIVAGNRAVSYAELWQGAVASAIFFQGRGVAPGDRVLIAARSMPAFAFAYFGAHLARAVAVPLEAAAPAQRAKELVRRINPKLVVGVDHSWATRPNPPRQPHIKSSSIFHRASSPEKCRKVLSWPTCCSPREPLTLPKASC
jgi:acyl-CoA synthetase (AMP-forming)/AMP-acid ligase II